MVPHTMAAAREHSIPFEVLDGTEVRRRFPAITPLDDDVGVLEPNAGYLIPEECIRAHLKLAAESGAQIHFEEKVLEWRADADGVELRTDAGTYEARHLVVTAGPWANQALADLFPLLVTRQVMAWIAPLGGVEPFEPEQFPVFLMEHANGPAGYGFPAIDGPEGGMKVAIHGSEDVCTPETVDRAIYAADLERIQRMLGARIPALRGEVLRAETCLYTTTPDEHFVIGRHPRAANCTVACGFSGHGFKFASVVGEVLADLSTAGATDHPIGLFDPGRWSG
jgi:sarcosine oxidase